MKKRNEKKVKDRNKKKEIRERRGKKFEETAKENFYFDAFSFTVCNVNLVTSQHQPLIIPCLLINPTILPLLRISCASCVLQFPPTTPQGLVSAFTVTSSFK
ncbi:hypothetical protein JHK82_042839 [Glycine max]|uniref:Uncharacterized protein n=1 Tax=Glycine soja TaxID=3848 RepID=A0A0B2SDA9_GLYSO|nr:hypothetical protein JHK82_042839 [Glycine max]KHN42242.1 hypothetical protein glysoja_048952 [Glycine soja]